MKNTLKNTGGVTGRGFDVAGQPSSSAKKAGWERRKAGIAFMDKVMRLQDLTIQEFEDLYLQMQENKDKFSLGDLIAYKYVSKTLTTDRFLIDWLDRHVGKASMRKEIEKVDTEPIEGIKVVIVNSRQELEKLNAAEH